MKTKIDIDLINTVKILGYLKHYKSAHYNTLHNCKLQTIHCSHTIKMIVCTDFH